MVIREISTPSSFLSDSAPIRRGVFARPDSKCKCCARVRGQASAPFWLLRIRWAERPASQIFMPALPVKTLNQHKLPHRPPDRFGEQHLLYPSSAVDQCHVRGKPGHTVVLPGRDRRRTGGQPPAETDNLF